MAAPRRLMAHRPEPDTLRLRDVAVFLFCGLAILLVLAVLVPAGAAA